MTISMAVIPHRRLITGQVVGSLYNPALPYPAHGFHFKTLLQFSLHNSTTDPWQPRNVHDNCDVLALPLTMIDHRVAPIRCSGMRNRDPVSKAPNGYFPPHHYLHYHLPLDRAPRTHIIQISNLLVIRYHASILPLGRLQHRMTVLLTASCHQGLLTACWHNRLQNQPHTHQQAQSSTLHGSGRPSA